jgi:hypothetical protein
MLFGLSGDLDTDHRFWKESEFWYEIDELWDSPGEALSPGEAFTGKELKDVQKWIKKKSKKRNTSVSALK